MNIHWTPSREIDTLQAAIDKYWRKDHVLVRDAALLRWQYRNLREPDCLSVLQATDGGRIVGALGLIQADFNDRGQRLPALWLATWFAAPDAPRGTGLALLRKTLESGAKVVACLGFNDTARTIYRALRFTVLESVPRWVRVVCPEALARLLASGGGGYAEKLAVLCENASRLPQPVPPTSLRIAPWNAEKEATWDRAWATCFAPRLVGTWRDSAYLRWRYLAHPSFRYRLLLAEDETDGSSHGLVAYRLESVQGASECVMRIVELLGDDAARPLLVAAVIQEARSAGAAFVDCFCTLLSSGQTLETNGFVRDDAMAPPLPMLFQPLDFRRTQVRAAFWMADGGPASADDLFDDTKLYVTRSDGDQDRPN